MQVAKSFLLGNDGDVVLTGIAHQFCSVGAGHCASGQCGQRIGRIGQRVLKVGGVYVHLVLGKHADLMLLKFERGNGAAR